jgi:hypothetical protein
MKSTLKKVLSLIGTLITIGSLVGGANGAILINIWEDGSDVRAQASGTLDISGLTFLFTAPFSDSLNIQPSDPELLFFGPGDIYGGFRFSPSFGTSRSTSGLSTGDHFGFEGNILLVPVGFVSGGSIFSEGVFLNTDLTILGANIGTYNYALPSSDTISLVIGSAPVPEPSSVILLWLGVVGLAATRRRKTQ